MEKKGEDDEVSGSGGEKTRKKGDENESNIRMGEKVGEEAKRRREKRCPKRERGEGEKEEKGETGDGMGVKG